MNLCLRFFSLLIIVFLTGCVSQKKVLYLQDLEEQEKIKINGGYDVKITYDDLLGITVNSRNPELTVPFTLQNGSVGSSSATGGSSSSGQNC